MKRKKLLIATLVSSVAGLVVDQVFLSPGSGPAKASADELMALGEAALTQPAVTNSDPAAPDAGAIRDLVASLGSRDLPASPTADVFASLTQTNGPAPETPAAAPSGAPVLSAVLRGRREAAAIINGLPIRVGQTRDGITLLGVEGDSARVRVNGRTVLVSVTR